MNDNQKLGVIAGFAGLIALFVTLACTLVSLKNDLRDEQAKTKRMEQAWQTLMTPEALNVSDQVRNATITAQETTKQLAVLASEGQQQRALLDRNGWIDDLRNVKNKTDSLDSDISRLRWRISDVESKRSCRCGK